PRRPCILNHYIPPNNFTDCKELMRISRRLVFMLLLTILVVVIILFLWLWTRYIKVEQDVYTVIYNVGKLQRPGVKDTLSSWNKVS
ncbi:3842_t:CDS:1, partial [Acaulospora colombiana]